MCKILFVFKIFYIFENIFFLKLASEVAVFSMCFKNVRKYTAKRYFSCFFIFPYTIPISK